MNAGPLHDKHPMMLCVKSKNAIANFPKEEKVRTE